MGNIAKRQIRVILDDSGYTPVHRRFLRSQAEQVSGPKRVDASLDASGRAATEFGKDAERAGARAEQGADKAARAADHAESRWKRLGMAVRTAVAAIAIRAMADLAQRSFELGASIQETADKYVGVFGPAAAQLDGWLAASAHQMGLTRREARDTAASFGAMGQAAGMAQKDAAGFAQTAMRLAADLASTNNTSSQQAFEGLMSGLRGEAEPLERLNVFLSEHAVQAKLATMTTEELGGASGEAAKMIARLALAEEQMARSGSLGNLEQTADSLANRARKAGAAWRELREGLATAVLPAAALILDKVEAMDAAAQASGSSFKELAAGALYDFVVLVVQIGYSVRDLVQTFMLFVGLQPSVGNASSGMSQALQGIGAVVSWVTYALGMAGSYFKQYVGVVAQAGALILRIVSKVVGALGTMLSAVPDLTNANKGMFGDLIPDGLVGAASTLRGYGQAATDAADSVGDLGVTVGDWGASMVDAAPQMRGQIRDMYASRDAAVAALVAQRGHYLEILAGVGALGDQSGALRETAEAAGDASAATDDNTAATGRGTTAANLSAEARRKATETLVEWTRAARLASETSDGARDALQGLFDAQDDLAQVVARFRDDGTAVYTELAQSVRSLSAEARQATDEYVTGKQREIAVLNLRLDDERKLAQVVSATAEARSRAAQGRLPAEAPDAASYGAVRSDQPAGPPRAYDPIAPLIRETERGLEAFASARERFTDALSASLDEAASEDQFAFVRARPQALLEAAQAYDEAERTYTEALVAGDSSDALRAAADDARTAYAAAAAGITGSLGEMATAGNLTAVEIQTVIERLTETGHAAQANRDSAAAAGAALKAQADAQQAVTDAAAAYADELSRVEIAERTGQFTAAQADVARRAAHDSAETGARALVTRLREQKVLTGEVADSVMELLDTLREGEDAVDVIGRISQALHGGLVRSLADADAALDTLEASLQTTTDPAIIAALQKLIDKIKEIREDAGTGPKKWGQKMISGLLEAVEIADTLSATLRSAGMGSAATVVSDVADVAADGAQLAAAVAKKDVIGSVKAGIALAGSVAKLIRGFGDRAEAERRAVRAYDRATEATERNTRAMLEREAVVGEGLTREQLDGATDGLGAARQQVAGIDQGLFGSSGLSEAQDAVNEYLQSLSARGLDVGDLQQQYQAALQISDTGARQRALNEILDLTEQRFADLADHLGEYGRGIAGAMRRYTDALQYGGETLEAAAARLWQDLDALGLGDVVAPLRGLVPGTPEWTAAVAAVWQQLQANPGLMPEGLSRDDLMQLLGMGGGGDGSASQSAAAVSSITAAQGSALLGYQQEQLRALRSILGEVTRIGAGVLAPPTSSVPPATAAAGAGAGGSTYVFQFDIHDGPSNDEILRIANEGIGRKLDEARPSGRGGRAVRRGA